MNRPQQQPSGHNPAEFARKSISEIADMIHRGDKPQPLTSDGELFIGDMPEKNPILMERVLSTEVKRGHKVNNPIKTAQDLHIKAKQLSKRTLKALTKHQPRKIITAARIHKYGLINFTRNAWLSVASIAIMIITLLIMSVTVLATQIANDTLETIKSQVDMSIYLKQDISNQDINEILADLKKLPSVKSFKYTSPTEARENYIRENLNNSDAMLAINEADNMFPGIINIQVVDINNTLELENFVRNNYTAASNLDTARLPSFASDRRSAIDKIASTANMIKGAGLVAGIVFMVIAVLMIFNTIRMAIFSRQDEIYMMGLIGASKAFIRGPFIIEAAIAGLIAAIISGFILLFALPKALPAMIQYDITAQPIFDWLGAHLALSLGGLYLAGIVLGALSSWMATRKYLK
ncbi:MAG: permease-like cell division protein FtsX [Candidatus Nomurabacteria bacterium]|jgi:cell division transport system permease protein|nr:permease-like cell division protein FtsX [Candidatus Nomurabacteria bacterium]